MDGQKKYSRGSDFTRFVFKRGKSAKRSKFPMGVIIGLVLIFLGAAFILDNLKLIYIEDVLQFWPCALIAMGLARLWNRGFLNVWGQLAVICGILLQFIWLGYDPFYDLFIDIWWPAFIIWFGLVIVIKACLPKKKHQKDTETSPDEYDWPRQGQDDIDTAPVTIKHENEVQSQ